MTEDFRSELSRCPATCCKHTPLPGRRDHGITQTPRARPADSASLTAHRPLPKAIFALFNSGIPPFPGVFQLGSQRGVWNRAPTPRLSFSFRRTFNRIYDFFDALCAASSLPPGPPLGHYERTLDAGWPICEDSPAVTPAWTTGYWIGELMHHHLGVSPLRRSSKDPRPGRRIAPPLRLRVLCRLELGCCHDYF